MDDSNSQSTSSVWFFDGTRLLFTWFAAIIGYLTYCAIVEHPTFFANIMFLSTMVLAPLWTVLRNKRNHRNHNLDCIDNHFS